MRRTERDELRFLLRDMPGGRRGWLLAAILLAILAALASVALVAAAGWLITASGMAGAAAALGVAITLEIFAPGALIRFFAVSRTVTRYLERLLVHESVFRLLARLRCRLFSQYARQPFAALMKLRDGPLLARFMADVARLEQFHAGLLIPLLAALSALAVLSLASGLLVGPWIGPWIGQWAALTVLLLLTTVILSLAAYLARHTRGSVRLTYAEARLRARLNDLLSAHRELYFSDPGDCQAVRLLNEADRLEHLENRQRDHAARLDAGLQLLFSLAVIALVGLAARGGADMAWIAMAVLGVVAAAALFSGLGEALRSWGGTRVALRRLRPGEPECSVNTMVPSRSPRGCWRLESVRLNRGLVDHPVLDNANLAIEAGEHLLISGRSGAGKTRLARLLAGMERPDDGQVLLDGYPAADWPEALRFGTVALLEQRSVILEGSLRYNLALANPEVPDSELLEAIQATGLNHGGPGLDDWIGDQSRPLSGGEARRVALIRVVLSGAPAIILDEPFRGLNRRDRQCVADWLEKRLVDRTAIYLDHQGDGYPAGLRHLPLGSF